MPRECPSPAHRQSFNTLFSPYRRSRPPRLGSDVDLPRRWPLPVGRVTVISLAGQRQCLLAPRELRGPHRSHRRATRLTISLAELSSPRRECIRATTAPRTQLLLVQTENYQPLRGIYLPRQPSTRPIICRDVICHQLRRVPSRCMEYSTGCADDGDWIAVDLPPKTALMWEAIPTVFVLLRLSMKLIAVTSQGGDPFRRSTSHPIPS